MKHSRYLALCSSLVDLSRAQIDKVLQELTDLRRLMDSSKALSDNEPTACRHCASRSLVRFGTQNGMQRFRCKACLKTCCATTKAKPADFHVQNVNSYHERIKTWIDYRLRGVASKYMPNYLAW